MNGNRPISANRRPNRPFQRRQQTAPPPPLEAERAVTELQRYLETAVREMGLELQFELTSTTGNEAEVAVLDHQCGDPQ